MKKPIIVITAVLLFAGMLFAAEQAGELRHSYANKAYGFTISPPEFATIADGSGLVAIFYAPGKDGFANNVNVMIQNNKTTRKEYLETSLTEFKDQKLTVNATKEVTVNGHDALLLDYQGTMSTFELHWLALAVFEKDRVILVTCTAKPDDFKALEKDFRACLDSFALTEKP